MEAFCFILFSASAAALLCLYEARHELEAERREHIRTRERIRELNDMYLDAGSDLAELKGRLRDLLDD